MKFLIAYVTGIVGTFLFMAVWLLVREKRIDRKEDLPMMTFWSALWPLAWLFMLGFWVAALADYIINSNSNKAE